MKAKDRISAFRKEVKRVGVRVSAALDALDVAERLGFIPDRIRHMEGSSVVLHWASGTRWCDLEFCADGLTLAFRVAHSRQDSGRSSDGFKVDKLSDVESVLRKHRAFLTGDKHKRSE